MTRLLAIVSGKGGIGKTTLAVNLGAAFTALSRDTVVVDADLSTPNIGIHVGTHHYDATLHDVLLGNAPMNEAVFFHHPSGLKFVPGHLSQHVSRVVKPESLQKLGHLLDGIAPVALLDCASGVREDTLSTIHASHEVLGVTTPDLPAVLDTLKVLNAAKDRGCFVRGVVVNRVTGSPYELTLAEVGSLLEAQVLGVVPEDAQMIEALRLTQPIVASHPTSPAALAIKGVAEVLLG